MYGPAFSLVVPTFNAAGTLAKALKSIIAQSDTDYEILVIDGGSDDGTSDTLSPFLPHIRYFISERDNGIYDAMNKGVQAARGDWVYLMGADDALAHDHVLEDIKKVILINPSAEIIYGQVQQVDIQHPLVPEVHRSAFGRGLLWKNTLHSQSCFYKRSLLLQHPFNIHYKILADYDLHLALWMRKTSATSVDTTVAVCSARGISKNFSPSLYSEEWQVKRNRLGIWRAWPQALWVWIKYSIKKAGKLSG
jgi:putative colanic acid biosynthesis glycosyltransferase